MSEPTLNELRQKEQEIAVGKARHDQPRVARAMELLEGMGAACLELAALAKDISADHVEAHLVALKLDRDRAELAMVSAERTLQAILREAAQREAEQTVSEA